jgi:8-oxo-dGTP pyrophosphatase MutT (NUDIX family)
MSKRRAELEVSAGGIVFRRLPGEAARYLLIRDSYSNWGFPKGHLEGDESPAQAAMRETAEETGLDQLVLQGPIRVIDWHFRFRGRHIHKYCHFFLFESPHGEACPQLDEGITACQWQPLSEALELLSYDNARGVLKRAGEMVRTLVAVGAGRAAGRADRRTGARSAERPDGQGQRRSAVPVEGSPEMSTTPANNLSDDEILESDDSHEAPSARPPVHPSA